MAGREALSAKEISDLRDGLVAEKAELERQLNEIEVGTFSSRQSELTGETSFDEEYADSGSATFERERDLSLENNVRDLLKKVDRALSRIEAGRYGACERCGQPIEKVRMKALPYADLCIADAQLSARR